MTLAAVWLQENVVTNKEDDLPFRGVHPAIPRRTLLHRWYFKECHGDHPRRITDNGSCLGISTVADNDGFHAVMDGLQFQRVEAPSQLLWAPVSGENNGEIGHVTKDTEESEESEESDE